MNSRILRKAILATVTVTAAAIAISACTGTKGASDVTDPRCGDAAIPYEGYATDEACSAVLDAETAGLVKTTGSGVPAVTGSSSATLAIGSSALQIAWTSPLDADGNAFLFDRRSHGTRKFAAGPTRNLHGRAGHSSVGRMLIEAINPISTAWAHLPPMTGTMHMIRIKGITGRAANDPFLAFTTKLSIAITGSNLAPILATTGAMQIELTDTYLTENVVVTPATDGPFRPATDVTLHVQ